MHECCGSWYMHREPNDNSCKNSNFDLLLLLFCVPRSCCSCLAVLFLPFFSISSPPPFWLIPQVIYYPFLLDINNYDVKYISYLRWKNIMSFIVYVLCALMWIVTLLKDTLFLEGVYCSCSACCGCTDVTIPTNTTSIANNAFYNCQGGYQLSNVVIST